MRYLIDKETRIIIHGFDSLIGKSITTNYHKKNINLVGGIEAGQGGNWSIDGRIPVFDSMQTAINALSPDAVLICVRSNNAYQAIIESIHAGIGTIICFTRDIPVKDLSKIKKLINGKNINFLGPNSFGIIKPGSYILGANLWAEMRNGRVGLIARSNLVALEIGHILAENGLGLSAAIGLGDYGEVGVSILDLLQRFDQDPETDIIILLENSVGSYDEDTHAFISDILSKPIVSYIPKIKNPVENDLTFTGYKNRYLFQQYLFKVSEFKKAGIPMVSNLLEIPEFIKNL